jgi:CheY-like chemotaxis protein
MVETAEHASARILVIDDNLAIHEDFRKVLPLASDKQTEILATAEETLFGEIASDTAAPFPFELDSAFQGCEGRDLVRRAIEQGRPYVLAFVDVRMPPGWDGVQTIARLWEEDSHLQVVVCTAYSDYSPQQLVERLGLTDRLLTLRKPFDPMEVRQLAYAQATKSRVILGRSQAAKSNDTQGVESTDSPPV